MSDTHEKTTKPDKEIDLEEYRKVSLYVPRNGDCLTHIIEILEMISGSTVWDANKERILVRGFRTALVKSIKLGLSRRVVCEEADDDGFDYNRSQLRGVYGD